MKGQKVSQACQMVCFLRARDIYYGETGQGSSQGYGRHRRRVICTVERNSSLQKKNGEFPFGESGHGGDCVRGVILTFGDTLIEKKTLGSGESRG